MKKYLVIICLLIFQNGLHAQEETQPENRTPESTGVPRTWLISIVPQFTLTKGFRFDIEKRIPNSVSAIVVSPRIFLGNIGESSFLNNSSATTFTITGFGAEIAHKLYLDEETEGARMWYLGYGVFYNNVSMAYENQDWVDFIGSDGNPRMSLEDVEQTVNINQIGGNVVIGALFWVDKRIYLDMQLGLGAKYADVDDSSSTNEHEDSFSRGVFNFGYTGTYPTGVIKVGVQF